MKKSVILFVQLNLLCFLPTVLELSTLISPYWILKILDEPTFALLILAAVLLWVQAAIFSVVACVVIGIKAENRRCVNIFSKVVYVGIMMYITALLDEPTFALLILAAVLLWVQAAIFSVVACVVIGIKAENRRCVNIFSKVVYVGIMMYITARFLMLTACIRFGSMFPMEKMERAFYFTIATFCYIWLIVLIFIFDHIFKRQRDKNVFSTLVYGIREIVNENNVII